MNKEMIFYSALADESLGSGAHQLTYDEVFSVDVTVMDT